MFKSNYIMYRVKTSPQGYEVKRRFRDFLWLRQSLVNEYPAYCIPPMAKTAATRQFEKKVVYKRMAVMQLFIDAVASHRELRSSQAFFSFLKLKEGKAWNKLKSELDKKTTRITVNSCPDFLSFWTILTIFRGLETRCPRSSTRRITRAL